MRSPEQSQEPNDDQIDGYDVIQKPRDNKNQYASDQRKQRLCDYGEFHFALLNATWQLYHMRRP